MSESAVPAVGEPAGKSRKAPSTAARSGSAPASGASARGPRAAVADVAQRAGNGAAVAMFGGGDGGFDDSDPAAVLAFDDPLMAARLDRMSALLLSAATSESRKRVVDYLSKGLGVGGTNVTRSAQVRDFRKRMKEAARARAKEDIAALGVQEDVGPVAKQYIDLIARGQAHGMAKESVDLALSDHAEGWLQQNWDSENDRYEAAQLPAIKRAMWAILAPSPLDPKLNSKAKKVGEELADKAAEARFATAKAAARTWKNAFVKPDGMDGDAVADAEVTRGQIGNEVAARTSGEKVGERALKASFDANSAEAGLSAIGKMLDKVIPQPGDSVEISVELTIPIPNSPAFVTLGFEGKAGRGTTGFTTAGFAKVGDGRRLEIMATISVGAGLGADLLGLKMEASGSVGFFVRSGADAGTEAAMTSLSYGAYRAATALSRRFGNWWAGSGAGVEEGKTQRSEIWAAWVEERIFAEDSSAFADLGGKLSAGASAEGKVAGNGFEGEAELAAELFRRYDQEGLEDSLGKKRFAQPVPSKEAARDRRKAASGRTVSSFGASGKTEWTINGQSVSFAAGFSGEKAAGDGNGFWKNWGVEISTALSLPPGADRTMVDAIVVGLVGGVLSSAQNIGQIVQKGSKEDGNANIATGALDTTSDIGHILNAGFKNELSTAINKSLTTGGEGVFSPESSLQAKVTFGRTGGKWAARFQVDESKSLTVEASGANAGVKIEVKRGKRLFAWGYEHKEDPDDPDETVGVWKLETVGIQHRRKEKA